MWRCWDSSFWPWPGGGFGFSGILGGLLVLAVLIWGIRALTGSGDHRRGARADRDDALRILRMRLADGSITEEEYEKLRRSVLS